eukprot:TRINITY_DN55363_c0_g1_i1.p1 TRINITY_DN55363_c0_g1~~TRINITY_DN55363_c0_g1_i1.p1  ORF type:complete len:382 (+),score=155.94 TRINITY_DN55363_c0_g1_i1:76-1146(+)
MRRAGLGACLAALLLGCSAAPAPRRGLALTSDHICSDLSLFASARPWFYGWNIHPGSTDYNNCVGKYDSGFVPQSWGKKTILNKTNWADIWPGADALLGFNEPNHAEQSDMTGAEAAAAWPMLVAAAKARNITRIGSPAAAPCGAPDCHGDTFEWFDAFFKACKDCQVDFIATHFYGCSGDALHQFLSELHNRYNRPIWLTEFNCGDGSNNRTMDRHLQYMQEALPVLDKLTFVERYSWMSVHNSHVPGCVLISDDGKLTELGSYYLKYAPAPPTPPPTPGLDWVEAHGTTCKQKQHLGEWFSLAQCETDAAQNAACTPPKTVMWEAGKSHNCYCSNATTCEREPSSWLNLYARSS